MSDDNLITVEELLRRIHQRCEGMSRSNENRALLEQCAVAITNLASRLPNTAGPTRTQSGLYIP